jgi:hypothetical protein
MGVLNVLEMSTRWRRLTTGLSVLLVVTASSYAVVSQDSGRTNVGYYPISLEQGLDIAGRAVRAAAIAGHLAFYADRVDAIEERRREPPG